MTTSHVDIWNDCLSVIRESISPQSFETWFRPVKPVKIEEQVLTIEVPSQFFYEWLEEHYVEMLKKAIRKALGPDGRLEYAIVIDKSANNPGSTIRQPSNQHAPEGNRSNTFSGMPGQTERPIPNNPFVIPGIRKLEVDSNLNPNYTFRNMIEGACNRLARSAGYAVAHKPGNTAYNPLFIYGGPGLGKTHMLQAIGNEIKQAHPKKTVLYLYSERFINQFIEATKNNSVNDFMNFYQMIDVLLVDDVQFFSGKVKSQDNFFHVFNHLRQSNKQIVLASDCPPHQLEGVEERLISRFKWGLTANLEQPDYQTRKSILKNKMLESGVELPEEIVDYLAHNITSNIRELEGALISLLAQSSLTRVEVTLELAQGMLRSLLAKPERELTIESIQQVVSEHFSMEVSLLKAKTRKREVVQARQIAMYFAKDLTHHSLKSIGLHFGGRDHSTVIHALQTVNDLMEIDKDFRRDVQEIRKRLSFQAG